MSGLPPAFQKQLARAAQTGVISFRTLDNRCITCRAEEIEVIVYNEDSNNEHTVTVHNQDYPVNYAQLKKLRWFLYQQGRQQHG